MTSLFGGAFISPLLFFPIRRAAIEIHYFSLFRWQNVVFLRYSSIFIHLLPCFSHNSNKDKHNKNRWMFATLTYVTDGADTDATQTHSCEYTIFFSCSNWNPQWSRAFFPLTSWWCEMFFFLHSVLCTSNKSPCLQPNTLDCSTH